MLDILEIFTNDRVSIILWSGMIALASCLNGLFSYRIYRAACRAGIAAKHPDIIGHLLEFVIVCLVVVLAFLCRVTVGAILHAPLFFTSLLVIVAGVEVGRTLNRYLEMRGISRQVDIGKAIDKVLGKDNVTNTNKSD
ncbi:hypothetical protein [Paramuribaculum intestinale]|uniref:hypothetical protein n=1 Tax=Paramuribaculum intestinale TaxID=2094151 RepID=UPI0025A9890B|nr:hypothetical protein [Paramuribaculum intestinale]